MAGEKASVDRNKSYDLINPFSGQPQSVPEAERETAYYDQDEITGTEKHPDPYDNDDEVYNGIEKDTSRIADKRDSLGDAVKKGHMKKLSETTSSTNPRKGDTVISASDRKMNRSSAHRHAVAQARGRKSSAANRLKTGAQALNPTTVGAARLVREAENPMVASSPTTSDNPMIGMYSMAPNNSNGSKYNLRSILESIALQAAETFEALDENAKIPDSFGSELDQCSKALNKLYSFVTQDQNSETGTTPIQGQNFMTKEESESYGLEEKLIGKQDNLDVSGPEGKPDNKLTGHDFKALRQQAKAKAKMEEAAFGVFGYILRNGK
jgi:hypothetical protein